MQRPNPFAAVLGAIAGLVLFVFLVVLVGGAILLGIAVLGIMLAVGAVASLLSGRGRRAGMPRVTFVTARFPYPERRDVLEGEIVSTTRSSRGELSAGED